MRRAADSRAGAWRPVLFTTATRRTESPTGRVSSWSTSGQGNSRSGTPRYTVIARDERGARAVLIAVPTSAEADANAFVARVRGGERGSAQMVVDSTQSASVLLAAVGVFLAVTWTSMALRIRKRDR